MDYRYRCIMTKMQRLGYGGKVNSQHAQPRWFGGRDFAVYATAEGSPGEIIRSTDPIDFIARPAPVAHVREAYGLVITGESMVPEYKPGETALINPLLPGHGRRGRKSFQTVHLLGRGRRFPRPPSDRAIDTAR